MTAKRKALRTDYAERLIRAPQSRVYAAFVDADVLVRWLPPEGAVGEFDQHDLRAPGGFRLRLTFEEPGEGEEAEGKTTADSDVVEVRISALEPDRRIVWEVDFVSDDPRFSGTMSMYWSLTPDGDDTFVTIDARNVPPGISARDHEEGLNSSLANLAGVVER